MPTPRSVAAFRERFRGVGAADRAEARGGSAEHRMTECLELHGLALWMDLERVMREQGAARPEDVVAEVNRRRLAVSR
jgi:hypothetical protein